MIDEDLIAALRSAHGKGLSQQEIAKRSRMSQGHLSKIISGAVPLTGKARQQLSGVVQLLQPNVFSKSAMDQFNARLRTLPTNDQEAIGTALLALLDALSSREKDA